MHADKTQCFLSSTSSCESQSKMAGVKVPAMQAAKHVQAVAEAEHQSHRLAAKMGTWILASRWSPAHETSCRDPIPSATLWSEMRGFDS